MPVLRLRMVWVGVVKPPYQLPTMAEIRALPWNGLVVASTFSGAGGSCLGYRMAGCRVAYAAEFVEAARDTYRLNHAGGVLDSRDVRQIPGADILDACGGGVDILDGSPPCAAFSTAGQRDRAWGAVKAYSDTEQRVDDLFDEYLRLVDEVRPRVFVAENVPGIAAGRSRGYFLRVLRSMRALGYDVECRVLDAQWLGVPQVRRRAIFMGVRADVDARPVFPTPRRWRYSVSDALPHVRRMMGGSYGGEWRPASQPSGTIVQSDGLRTHRRLVETAAGKPRQMTIDELRAICGFPADFKLTGTYVQQWERLGRAVPPPMMAAVAAAIRKEVLT